MYRFFQHAFGRFTLSGALQMNVPEMILFPLLKNMPEVMIQENKGVSFIKKSILSFANFLYMQCPLSILPKSSSILYFLVQAVLDGRFTYSFVKEVVRCLVKYSKDLFTISLGLRTWGYSTKRQMPKEYRQLFIETHEYIVFRSQQYE